MVCPPEEAVIFMPTTFVVIGLLLFVFRLMWWWFIAGGLLPSSSLPVGVVVLETDLSSSSLLMRLGELTRIRSGERTGEEAERCVVVGGVPELGGR